MQKSAKSLKSLRAAREKPADRGDECDQKPFHIETSDLTGASLDKAGAIYPEAGRESREAGVNPIKPPRPGSCRTLISDVFLGCQEVGSDDLLAKMAYLLWPLPGTLTFTSFEQVPVSVSQT